MSPSWLIVADDLTGAADCAVAFAKSNIPASVVWDGEWAETPAVSINVESRSLSAQQAADLHRKILEDRLQTGTRLYKKIDSTIRGQPAAETAATIDVLKARGCGAFAVLAPAFPDTGRTTEAGCVRVQGLPLEETPLWARDHTYETADLSAMLSGQGIKTRVIGIDTIRQGADATQSAIADAMRNDLGAVVCDAIDRKDLDTIALATLPMAGELFWIGTGGLAVSLAKEDSRAERSATLQAPQRRGGILVAVGSLAEASRSAATYLARSGRVRHSALSPDLLFAGNGMELENRVSAIVADIASGQDVLVEIALTERPNLTKGRELAAQFASALKPVTALAGGLIVTGGDTAAAMLEAFDIRGIRLAGEVESGVPLGLTVGPFSLPIVTKAGAFGKETILADSLDRLNIVKEKGLF